MDDVPAAAPLDEPLSQSIEQLLDVSVFVQVPLASDSASISVHSHLAPRLAVVPLAMKSAATKTMVRPRK